MLVLALMMQPLAERFRLPFPAALVLAGFLGSEVLVATGRDTGLRIDDFHDLIFYVFLPVLIFESAFTIDARALLMGATATLEMFSERWLAMLIAILGVLAARTLGVFGVLPVVSLMPGVAKIPASYHAARSGEACGAR